MSESRKKVIERHVAKVQALPFWAAAKKIKFKNQPLILFSIRGHLRDSRACFSSLFLPANNANLH